MRIRARSIYVAHHIALAGVIGFFMPGAPTAQENSIKQPDKEIIVRVARVLNVRSGSYIKNAAIRIEGERIKAVGREIDVLKEAPASAQILDLGDVTVLPGLIDCHTHLMARLPDGANAYALNLLTKSEGYRALEGAANARATLEAGFTTVRDVENEGSAYADVALRDAINNGLVAGPRMRVATRASPRSVNMSPLASRLI